MTNNTTYNSYHTFIILLEKAGILPDELKKIIPRQTRYHFRKKELSRIIGLDLANSFSNNTELFIRIFNSEKTIRLLKNAIKIKNTIISIIDSFKNGKTDLIKIKKKIVHIITNVKESIGFKRALKYFNISKAKYFTWVNEINNTCKDSVYKKCLRIWPAQLTKNEVNKLKKMLFDEKYKFWPIASIAFHALRNDILCACLSTWYKYAKILGYKNFKPLSRRKKNKVGKRANKANETIHIDLTEFVTADNIRAYIYFVIDNYSRRILSFQVSLIKNAKITFDNIKEAYLKYIQPQIKDNEITEVYMDKGSENKGVAGEYIDRNDIALTKIFARVDVDFSNSMIEAFNRTIKYNYLYRIPIPDINALQKAIEYFVEDYNNRPHYSLAGLTPVEVHSGKIPDYSVYNNIFKKAKSDRIYINTESFCNGVCK